MVIVAGILSFTTAQRAVAWQGTKVTSHEQTLASASIPTVGFSSSIYHVGEGDGSATVTVTLDSPYTSTVTVDYATSDGTALAGSDYFTASGGITFSPGITISFFTVPILDDSLIEPSETVSLTLSQPTDATLGLLRSARLTILDDEPNFVYLPLALQSHSSQYVCPTTSTNQYAAGTAYQYDNDNPVRPAYNHADKNIELRGYTPNSDANLQRELVDYGAGDELAPQLATLFAPYGVPTLTGFYRVHDWAWALSPDPGSRGDPITIWPVTALGMATTPGEPLLVPASGYSIGGIYEVVVLYADEDTVALKYAREDSAGAPGYTVHIDNICTDPNLLALYDSLDDPDGPRNVYVPPENRPHGYSLPALPAGQPVGVARSAETVVAIVDTGAIMDTRSCNEWWIERSGYPGTCPPAQLP
jgi:hypothetical protein